MPIVLIRVSSPLVILTLSEIASSISDAGTQAVSSRRFFLSLFKNRQTNKAKGEPPSCVIWRKSMPGGMVFRPLDLGHVCIDRVGWVGWIGSGQCRPEAQKFRQNFCEIRIAFERTRDGQTGGLIPGLLSQSPTRIRWMIINGNIGCAFGSLGSPSVCRPYECESFGGTFFRFCSATIAVLLRAGWHIMCWFSGGAPNQSISPPRTSSSSPGSSSARRHGRHKFLVGEVRLHHQLFRSSAGGC